MLVEINTLNRYERFFSLHVVILQRIYSDTQNFPDSFPTLCVVQNLYFFFEKYTILFTRLYLSQRPIKDD